MARTARSSSRAHVALPVAIVVALAPALAACSDDSAGPETGADVQDVVEEQETATDEELAAEEDTLVEDEEQILEEEGEEEEVAAGGMGLQEEAGSLVGQSVTVSATVTEVLSDTALRIGENTDESLLVLSVNGPLTDIGLEVADDSLVEEERIVQVTGTVARLDFAAFEEEYGVALDEGLYGDFEGQNVIVADEVATLTGQEVTVAGEVSNLVSTVAFRLAGVGWDVLVLDAEQAAVAEGDPVQVTGTVRRFEVTTIEDELGQDLDDTLYEEFEGDLVLVADTIEPAALNQ